MRPAAVLVLGVLLLACGCAAEPDRPDPVDAARGAEDHYHVRAAKGRSVGWVIFLPGSSGLSILGDADHYFRAAEPMTAAGLDVVVVDYKNAYRASPDRPDVPTADKIAWVTRRAIAWAREQEVVADGDPGAIVAWSLGAEGVWSLARDGGLQEVGVRRAVVYYPSVELAASPGGMVGLGVPVLVLSGEADDVTPMTEIRAALPPGEAEIVAYPGAHHGFDVESIVEPARLRFPPLIGAPKTFAYDADAASDARERALAFLLETTPGHSANPNAAP